MKNSLGEVFRRREFIYNQLIDKGLIFIKETALELGVSELTIRRDLQLFEKKGMIQKFHGGASWKGTELDFTKYDYSLTVTQDAIVQGALTIVDFKPGNLVFVNSGILSLKILEKLQAYPIQLITTNTQTILDSKVIEKHQEAILMLAGGILTEPKKSLTGDVPIHLFSSLKSSICFVEVEGVTETEVSTITLGDSFVDRVLVENTEGYKVIMTEGKNIGKDSNFMIAPVKLFTHLVTDKDADVNVIQKLKKIGISVIIT